MPCRCKGTQAPVGGTFGRRKNKCGFPLVQLGGNPQHCSIIEPFSMRNDGKWITGQWVFGEDIDKRKRNPHCTLSGMGIQRERWGFIGLVSVNKPGQKGECP